MNGYVFGVYGAKIGLIIREFIVNFGAPFGALFLAGAGYIGAMGMSLEVGLFLNAHSTLTPMFLLLSCIVGIFTRMLLPDWDVEQKSWATFVVTIFLVVGAVRLWGTWASLLEPIHFAWAAIFVYVGWLGLDSYLVSVFFAKKARKPNMN